MPRLFSKRKRIIQPRDVPSRKRRKPASLPTSDNSDEEDTTQLRRSRRLRRTALPNDGYNVLNTASDWDTATESSPSPAPKITDEIPPGHPFEHHHAAVTLTAKIDEGLEEQFPDELIRDLETAYAQGLAFPSESASKMPSIPVAPIEYVIHKGTYTHSPWTRHTFEPCPRCPRHWSVEKANLALLSHFQDHKDGSDQLDYGGDDTEGNYIRAGVATELSNPEFLCMHAVRRGMLDGDSTLLARSRSALWRSARDGWFGTWTLFWGPRARGMIGRRREVELVRAWSEWRYPHSHMKYDCRI